MIVIKSAPVRQSLRYLIPFGLIPAAVILGAVVFDDKRWLIISLGVALLSLLLFLAGVEKKNIGSRRMVLVAVMTALAVIGRFIPVFKPVTAICILSGMYLGAEAGFLTGALSALISNLYFGQGPWTPFQMLSLGLIGLCAGYLSRPLIRRRVLLILCGAVAGAMYSLIMDVWTVVWYAGGFEWELYLAAIGSALPFTLVYMLSNASFLILLRRPFGEKLGRIKLKYGI